MNLERFFASDNLSNDRAGKNLLNMPKAKMEAELERLYLKSELKIDDRCNSSRLRRAVVGRERPRGPGAARSGSARATGRGRRPDGPPPGEAIWTRRPATRSI